LDIASQSRPGRDSGEKNDVGDDIREQAEKRSTIEDRIYK